MSQRSFLEALGVILTNVANISAMIDKMQETMKSEAVTVIKTLETDAPDYVKIISSTLGGSEELMQATDFHVAVQSFKKLEKKFVEKQKEILKLLQINVKELQDKDNEKLEELEDPNLEIIIFNANKLLQTQYLRALNSTFNEFKTTYLELLRESTRAVRGIAFSLAQQGRIELAPEEQKSRKRKKL